MKKSGRRLKNLLLAPFRWLWQGLKYTGDVIVLILQIIGEAFD